MEQERKNWHTHRDKPFQRTKDGHLLLMSNEVRNLLITDLTARLNYGVICLIERVDDFGPMHRDEKLTGFCFEEGGYFHFEVCGGLDIVFAEKIIPYLRPMSSMTDEEREEFRTLISPEASCAYEDCLEWDAQIIGGGHLQISVWDFSKVMDWLNAHHFDYRGLIEKGLALEAKEGMYKNE